MDPFVAPSGPKRSTPVRTFTFVQVELNGKSAVLRRLQREPSGSEAECGASETDAFGGDVLAAKVGLKLEHDAKGCARTARRLVAF